jgi:hypothetical protein
MSRWQALLIALLAARPDLASAGADLVLSGPVDAVVTAGARVAVVQEDEVRLLTTDGTPLRRLGGAGPPGARRDWRARSGERPADEVLELHDLPDEERDSTLVEDLVDDELTLRQRHRAGPAPGSAEDDAPPRPLVAAGRDDIWAVTRGTLWRVDARGRAVRSAGLIPRLDRLAADPDGALVVAAGPHLWQSRDGGTTFAPAAETDGPVRALAAAGGRMAWATDRRLSWTDGRHHRGSLVLPARALAVRFCGDVLLALHRRGLLAVDASGAPSVIATPGPALRLGCGRDGAWWLIGPGLVVSRDRGRTFVAPPALPPLPITDAVADADGLWLATPAGLFQWRDGQDLAGHGRGQAPSVADRALAPALDGVVVARERARWASLLPRLVIAASATVAPGGTDVRALAYADFPLGERVPATAATAPGLAYLAFDDPPRPPAEPGRPSIGSVMPGGGMDTVAPTSVTTPDPDLGCLERARAAAVALALAEPDRARSYIARAGRAAWLPELRIRVDRRIGRSESLDVPAGNVTGIGPLGLDSANDVRYEARATWDLSRLVFSPDEIAAQAQALRMADVRREVESLVNRLYFERRRLTMDQEPDPVADPVAAARRTLRADELHADLEALSGGAFARCLAARTP